MKISISKIYEKALSIFVVQKNMAILKRPVKVSDIPGYTIMEDILFIGPSENEQPDSLKRQFHERLNLLPK